MALLACERGGQRAILLRPRKQLSIIDDGQQVSQRLCVWPARVACLGEFAVQWIDLEPEYEAT